MNTKDRIILVLVVGIVTMLLLLVGGEVVMSHNQDAKVSEDIIHLVEKGMIGLIGIVAGYMGGKTDKDKE